MSSRSLRRRRTIAAQILTMQTGILVLTLGVGFFLVVSFQHGQLDRQYERRALAVAQSTAASPQVQQAVSAGDPGGVVQRLAMAVRKATGVEFVVITNSKGIRYSHPNPALIGKPVYDDPEPAASEPFRTGRPWLGIQKGTLGMTARGKVPLFDRHHRLIGEVSVGIKAAAVSESFAASLRAVAGLLAAVLALGAALSIALSRRMKRQTFGLELDEIAGLLQEREAMLRGIREGLLGIDKHGRVLLVNDEARRLFSLPVGIRRRPVTDLFPPGHLRDVITGDADGTDQVVVAGDRVIVANRMPIRVNHRDHLGWVVTFQDRTESEALLRELDTVVGLTEALRAQSHEFSNRLHTLAGLIQLGRYEEAVAFVESVTAGRNGLMRLLVETVEEPTIAALLLGKSSVAAERAIDFRLAASGRLACVPAALSDVLRVVGNLIDNALDAAGEGRPEEPYVEVRLRATGSDLLLAVEDSGPGIPEPARELIFTDGWSTKPSRTGARRGLGLALVRETVARYGGSVEVSSAPGAVFTVHLPGVLVPAALPGELART